MPSASVTSYDVKVALDTSVPNNVQSGRPGFADNPLSYCLWKAGSGAPDPKHGDQITIDSVTYVIASAADECRSVYAITVRQQRANT